jgi:hypothetical protein
LAAVVLLVLLPQQLQGHAGAAQFAVDVGVIGLEVAGCPCHGRLVQTSLEFFVAQ